MALYRHLGDQERHPAPEEWVLAALAETWQALPYPGALVEQPYRLMLIGARMRQFAQAYGMTREMEQPPAWATRTVAHVQALSAIAGSA